MPPDCAFKKHAILPSVSPSLQTFITIMANDNTPAPAPAPASAPAPTGGEAAPRRSSFSQVKAKVLRPFKSAEVKILLLENVNETAIKAFQKQGYQVNKKFMV